MANNINVKPSDINHAEDSLIVGRVKTKIGVPEFCPSSPGLSPSFHLYNSTDKSGEWLRLYGEMSFEKSWPGLEEGYGKMILRKGTPGDYLFSICGTKCVTLTKFTVPKGKLVYFGTIEFDRYCGGVNRPGNLEKYLLFYGRVTMPPGVAQYLKYINVLDESEKTIRLLKTQYPQVYEMYRNDILSLQK